MVGHWPITIIGAVRRSWRTYRLFRLRWRRILWTRRQRNRWLVYWFRIVRHLKIVLRVKRM